MMDGVKVSAFGAWSSIVAVSPPAANQRSNTIHSQMYGQDKDIELGQRKNIPYDYQCAIAVK